MQAMRAAGGALKVMHRNEPKKMRSPPGAVLPGLPTPPAALPRESAPPGAHTAPLHVQLAVLETAPSSTEEVEGGRT